MFKRGSGGGGAFATSSNRNPRFDGYMAWLYVIPINDTRRNGGVQRKLF